MRHVYYPKECTACEVYFRRIVWTKSASRLRSTYSNLDLSIDLIPFNRQRQNQVQRELLEAAKVWYLLYIFIFFRFCSSYVRVSTSMIKNLNVWGLMELYGHKYQIGWHILLWAFLWSFVLNKKETKSLIFRKLTILLSLPCDTASKVHSSNAS